MSGYLRAAPAWWRASASRDHGMQELHRLILQSSEQYPAGQRPWKTALRSNLGDTGYQPAWRIPANLDRCCQPDDLKRTEFGQDEAHLFDAFR
jgi:hypothetical protein